MIAPGPATDQATVGQPVLEVEGLTVEFAGEGDRWVRVVDDVDLTVRPGETLGLVGESGSGKSVTSLAIMGLVRGHGARVAAGSVRLSGRELVGLSERALSRVRGDEIAMIFQEPMTSLNPAFTVGEQIAEVLRRHRGLGRRAARAAAVRSLDQVGIAAAERQLDRYPHEFSGGMRQRAMIAMAISCEPKMIIADEPTTALDVTIQAQILDVLRSMSADLNIGLLFITHSMGVVADICDRVAVMYAGHVVETADVFDLFAAPRHPYTEGLLRAVPPLERTTGVLPSIPGHPPDLRWLPPGCRFAPRCPYSVAACEAGPVALEQLGSRESRCVRTHELHLGGVR